jgi:hypothetical protein
MNGDEHPEAIPPIQDEVLQASLARAILPSVQETPVYRVSGVKPGSGKPKAKNSARKAVAKLEQETVPTTVS